MISEQLTEYFDKLDILGIPLSNGQKRWYAAKWQLMGEDTFREYPSYPDEAFAASQDGYWYASEMKGLIDAGHITNLSYDKALVVHTAFDLGQHDHQVIWFFQVTKSGEIHVIDFFKKTNTDIALTKTLLDSKGYTYGTHIWPHDANSRDKAGITYVQQASNLNLKGYVLERSGLLDGIRLVRTSFGKFWFDQNKCKQGIHDLAAYKKKWSSQICGWSSEPMHDDASHTADAFRYLCQGLPHVSSNNDLKQDYDAIRKFWG